MHTIENTSNVGFGQIDIAKTSLLRIVASLIVGAIVTFALFAGMQALIKQDGQRTVEVTPIKVFSSILDIPEEKVIQITRLKPPPVMQEAPTTPIEMPLEPSSNTGFTNVIKIPGIETGIVDFNVQAIDQQPRPIVRIDPRYPAVAANNGIEGFVRLSFSVSGSGEVTDVNVIESEPRRVFDKAAKQALRKWRYQPKMVSGSPVGMDGLQVRLDFTLAKK